MIPLHSFLATIVERNIGVTVLEEFISDSVIVLYYFKSETTFTRAITIWKMRATNHSKKIHPYEIGEHGGVTYPQEEAVMK